MGFLTSEHPPGSRVLVKVDGTELESPKYSALSCGNHQEIPQTASSMNIFEINDFILLPLTPVSCHWKVALHASLYAVGCCCISFHYSQSLLPGSVRTVHLRVALGICVH